MSRIDYWATTSTHEYMYEKAWEYYSNGNYTDALTLYSELMNSGVDDELYYNAALCCNKLNKQEQAVEFLEKSLALNDRRFDGFILLAEIYTSLNSASKAIYNYTRARALKPDHSGACAALVDLYAKQGQKFESDYYRSRFLQYTKDKRSALYRSLNAENNNARAEAGRYFLTASRAFARGDLFTAKRDYKSGLDIYPADYESNFTYARVCNDLGDNTEAVKYFIRAMFLNNENAGLYMYIASVYSKLRDYSRAYCFLKRYLTLLVSTHNQAEYLKTIQSIKSLEPYSKNGSVSVSSAENYFNSNRYFEAYLEYGNLVILSEGKNSDIEVRLQLLELMVHPDTYWSKLYLRKGQALYDSGKIREANSFFSRVMEILPPNSSGYKLARSKITNV